MALNYQYICRTPSEIPEEAYSRLRRDIGMDVGQPFRKLFPRFAQAFARTTEALEEHWPIPEIVCKKWRNDWLVMAVLSRNDLNLYLNLVIASEPIEGEEFEREHSMLPTRWVELYRVFWSFVITDSPVMPMQWKNTPFSYPARLSLEEFRRHIGAKKAAALGFEKITGASPDFLHCWLWNDAGDALFIDEKKRDKRVFHVRGNNLTDVSVLRDAEETLDEYLAHIVAGRKPAEFDFRQ